MEGKVKLSIRTATRDRKADITAPLDATVGRFSALPEELEFVRAVRVYSAFRATGSSATRRPDLSAGWRGRR